MGLSKNQFQTTMKKQILIYSSILVLVLSACLAGYVFFYKTIENNTALSKSNKEAMKSIGEVYQTYRQHLLEMKTNPVFQAYLLGIGNQSDIFQDYYTFNLNNAVKSHMVLLNEREEVVVSSLDMSQQNLQLNFVNQMIVSRIKEQPSSIISSAFLLQLQEGHSSYVMGGSVFDEGNLVGYVIYYLRSEDLNRMLRNRISRDVIVTDMLGKVIAATNNQHITNYNQFRPTNSPIHMEQGVPYVIKQQYIADYQMNVYSLMYDSRSVEEYLQWSFLILLFGIGLIVFSSYFADKFAVNNSKSINELFYAANKIKEGNVDYRIQLQSKDEFELFAKQFNEMLDELGHLGTRNMELMDIRRITEIKRLEAQFNPHFLFNTLETIRYGILLNPKLASDLTMKLTKILRYSINNNVSVVSLEEDLHYIHDFLKIQSYRFEDRFQYTIDVSEECYTVKVPKLVLQPLIENSCKYGFVNRDYLTIYIKGRVDHYATHKVMVLSVEDNGMGIDAELLANIQANVNKEENVSENIGLHNIKRRLVLLFGKASDLKIESRKHFGTKVTLEIILESDAHV